MVRIKSRNLKHIDVDGKIHMDSDLLRADLFMGRKDQKPFSVFSITASNNSDKRHHCIRFLKIEEIQFSFPVVCLQETRVVRKLIYQENKRFELTFQNKFVVTTVISSMALPVMDSLAEKVTLIN